MRTIFSPVKVASGIGKEGV